VGHKTKERQSAKKGAKTRRYKQHQSAFQDKTSNADKGNLYEDDDLRSSGSVKDGQSE